jgi:hypothetical protein
MSRVLVGNSHIRSLVLWSALMILITACQSQAEPRAEEALPTLMDLPTETVTPTPVEQGRIEFWQPVSAEFTAGEAVHLWSFVAQSGDRVSLRAVGSGVRVLLRILTPDGRELPDTNEELLSAAGDYTVQVIRIGDELGSYELGLSYSGQPNPNDATETPLPVIVGVPTPLPVSADLGTFIDELESGETLGGTLTTEDNQHVYIFKAPVEGYAAVEVTRVNGDLNPFLTIYDPDGRSIAVDGQSRGDGRALLQNLRMSRPEAYYTLQVSGKGFAGSYSVRWTRSDQALSLTPQVEIVTTPTPVTLPMETPELVADEDTEGRLQDHVPVQALLEEPSDLKRHTFIANAGEILTAGVIPIEGSTLLPFVELYDPDGALVIGLSGETSGPSRAALIPTFTASMSGPYTLFVTAQGETSGAYIVGYGSGSTLVDRVRGDAMIDAPNSAQLVFPGDRDIWTVNLRQGDLISVSVVGEGLLEPVLELVAENGDLIGIDYNSGGAQRPVISGVTIPRSGVYYIRVRPATPQNLGNYTLTWRYISVAPTATPPVGTVSLVALDDTISDGEYKFYPFQAQTGQNLRITVAGAPNMTFDPVISILDSEAEVIAEGDDSQNSLNAIVYLRIPADGTYAVRVNGYLQGGDFSLLVDELIEVGR